MQFRSPTASRKERIAAGEIMAGGRSTTSPRSGQVYRIIATRFATKGGWTRVPRLDHPQGGRMSDRQRKLGRRSVLKGLAAGTAAAAVPTILARKASAQQEKTLRIV